jgi:hypothetical protein
MKTLSRTFVFVALAVIGIVAIFAFRRAFTRGPAKQDFPDQKFVLKIGKIGAHPKEYADVWSETDFATALDAVRSKGGHYKFHFKRNDNTETDYNHFPGTPSASGTSALSIKTDKVTTSALAKNGPTGESAANDPNATYRVTSADPGVIKGVVDTLKVGP